MKLCLIFASALIIGALAVPTPLAPSDALLAHERENEAHFQSWKAEHGKEYYTQEEHDSRLQIFSENKAIVEQHNSEGHSWTLHLNKFADMTASEFASRHGFMGHMSTTGTDDSTAPERHNITGEAPTTMDWRQHNLVNPIKNQEQCGSCWSFSATGALEGAYQIKNGNLKSYSEQHLVSCDTTDSGCNGGLMDNAFAWTKSNGGICEESDYPYTSGTSGKSGSCAASCTKDAGIAPKSYTDVQKYSDDALMSAIAQQPVSIAIQADQSTFQLYQSGVLTAACGSRLDHGVLAVGYGTWSDGTDYYKVKNSWGASWGMDGYILLERGNTDNVNLRGQNAGQCGILSGPPSYPNL